MIKLFLTNRITTELPGKFIRNISDDDYNKFFQNGTIVKDDAVLTFNKFKLAFESKIVSSKKETEKNIVERLIKMMPHLEVLSDSEIDQIKATLNTPQGYLIKEIVKTLVENIDDILRDRAEEIALSCFDQYIELVDLNKAKGPETKPIGLN